MALVKLSGIIGEIKGSIGGSVFSNSGAGLVLKTKTTPVNRNTIKQNNQRIIINDLQSQWINLSPFQRDCWVQWLKLFPIKQNNFNKLNINAQQAFIKINVPFRLYGHPILLVPVFRPSTIQPISFSMSVGGGNLLLASDRRLNNVNEFIELLCTVVLPITRINPGSLFKSVIFATNSLLSQNVSIPYTDVFGILPVVGRQIFFKVRTIDLELGTPSGFQQENVILA